MQKRKEEEKQQFMAESIASPFSDAIESGFALSGGETSGSLGFMDMLSLQGFSQFFFEMIPPPPLRSPAMAPPQESPETANFPASSNSSSISSSSIDPDPSMLSSMPTAAPFEASEYDESLKVDGENKTSGANSKEGKKKGQKRQREPRIAFMTKSDVDHLEDGYRWRKYGQKAVKNSPFPRGYYRCTSALCGVKKRVERSFVDPSVVVTTYEGQHTHPTIPVMPRVKPPFPSALSDLHRLQAQHPIFSSHRQLISDNSSSQSPADVAATMNDGRRYCTPVVGSDFRDKGLLQDLIPSELMKKES